MTKEEEDFPPGFANQENTTWEIPKVFLSKNEIRKFLHPDFGNSNESPRMEEDKSKTVMFLSQIFILPGFIPESEKEGSASQNEEALLQIQRICEKRVRVIGGSKVFLWKK